MSSDGWQKNHQLVICYSLNGVITNPYKWLKKYMGNWSEHNFQGIYVNFQGVFVPGKVWLFVRYFQPPDLDLRILP